MGVDALSNFGAQFFESMDKLHAECVKLREGAVSELEEAKRESEEYQCELKQLFPSNKTEEQRKEEYQKVRVRLQVTKIELSKESSSLGFVLFLLCKMLEVCAT